MLQNMSIDHGGLDIFVAEQFLHGADVIAILEQLSGKTMAKGMRGDNLCQIHRFHSLPNSLFSETAIFKG